MLSTPMRISRVAVAQLSFFCLFAGAACPQKPTPLDFSTEQQSELHGLASRILQHADKAGCKKNSCTILVVNFAGPTGATSTLGMQLADALSLQLSAQAAGIQIVDRAKLQQYLEKERITSKLLEDDNAARWLAMENGATTVLIGYLKVGLTQASLHVQLLDTRDFGKGDGRGKTLVEEETFKDISNFGDLEPAEPFGAPRELAKPKDWVALHDSPPDAKRISSYPRCTYHPDPSYTNAARTVKFQGTIVLQVVISQEGAIVDSQILKGLPFGLNKQALETVFKWRCQPATAEERAVSTTIPVEITFRLF